MIQQADRLYRQGPRWMPFMPPALGFAIILLAGPGCRRQQLAPYLSSIQANVFDIYCSDFGCHQGTSYQSDLNLEPKESYASLVNHPSIGIPDLMRVVPGHPEQSYLLRKLAGNHIVGERMPMGRPPLPDSVIAVIQAWIAAGAPAD